MRFSAATAYTIVAVLILLILYSRSVTLLTTTTTQQRYVHTRNSRARLKLVQVVFRHGSRSPLNLIYYNTTTWDVCPSRYEGFQIDVVNADSSKAAPPLVDKDALPLPGGCKMGQLTAKGFSQAKELGAWLRHRYTQEFSILPVQYTQGAIFAWTTSFTRTINTLRGVITGMYPESAEQQSLTAVSVDVSEEIMYGYNNTCPRLGPLIDARVAAIAKRESLDKVVQKDVRFVAKALGLKAEEGIMWNKLYDSVAAMQAVGKQVSGLGKDVWKRIVKRATIHEEAVIAPCGGSGEAPKLACKETLQLSLGRLANELLSNLNRAVNCYTGHTSSFTPSGKKACKGAVMRLYSGHDSTIIPLMAMLGHPLDEWPKFASNVVIELWQYTSIRNTVSHYIRVLYNGEHMQLRKSTELGTLIPYDEFVHHLKSYSLTSKQHDEACSLNHNAAKHG